MTEKVLKIGGLVMSGIGAVITIASGIIEDKKLDFKVDKAVAEALKNINK